MFSCCLNASMVAVMGPVAWDGQVEGPSHTEWSLLDQGDVSVWGLAPEAGRDYDTWIGDVRHTERLGGRGVC